MLVAVLPLSVLAMIVAVAPSATETPPPIVAVLSRIAVCSSVTLLPVPLQWTAPPSAAELFDKVLSRITNFESATPRSAPPAAVAVFPFNVLSEIVSVPPEENRTPAPSSPDWPPVRVRLFSVRLM